MIETLQQKFKDDGISCNEQWLQSIINSGVTDKSKILSILINTDISDCCTPCSLPDLHANKLYTIQSPIFLQINEVTDISISLEERKHEKISSFGTLKVLMTDGLNNFIGISKDPITSFSPSVVPGSKIILNPPVDARYGVLFLSERKFRFLNGKSEKILQKRNQIYSKYQPTQNPRLNQNKSQSQSQNNNQSQNQNNNQSQGQVQRSNSIQQQAQPYFKNTNNYNQQQLQRNEQRLQRNEQQPPPDGNEDEDIHYLTNEDDFDDSYLNEDGYNGAGDSEDTEIIEEENIEQPGTLEDIDIVEQVNDEDFENLPTNEMKILNEIDSKQNSSRNKTTDNQNDSQSKSISTSFSVQNNDKNTAGNSNKSTRTDDEKECTFVSDGEQDINQNGNIINVCKKTKIFSDDDSDTGIVMGRIGSSITKGPVNIDYYDQDGIYVDSASSDDDKNKDKNKTTNQKFFSSSSHSLSASSSMDLEDSESNDENLKETRNKKMVITKVDSKNHFLSEYSDDTIENDSDDDDVIHYGEKLFSIHDLINKEPLLQAECFETVKTSAKIVFCSEFLIIKKGNRKLFSLTVTLRDSTGEMKVKVESGFLSKILGVDTNEFDNLSEKEKKNMFGIIEKKLKVLSPPITLIDRSASDDGRFVLTETA